MDIRDQRDLDPTDAGSTAKSSWFQRHATALLLATFVILTVVMVAFEKAGR